MTKGEVKITFEEMGGSTVADIVMAPGKVPVKPESPIRHGYVFKGWYTDSGLTVPYNWNSVLNNNMTLYAKWETSLSYSTHIANVGWVAYVTDDAVAGTTGQGLRIEAIKIRLTGAEALNYDIYYKVYSPVFGWLDWAKNGEIAGTVGYSYRMEAIKIIIVPKGEGLPIGERSDIPFRIR